MLKSKKECFDWDLNTLNSHRNFSISEKERRRSKVIDNNLFKSYVFNTRASTPNPRNVKILFFN